MLIDLKTLCESIKQKESEDCVPMRDVNPYLYNEVLKPLLEGKALTYGEIDFSMFDTNDLRIISDYCDKRERLSYKLEEFVGKIDSAKAYACTKRAYC